MSAAARPLTSAEVARHAAAIRERGYAVIPELYTPAAVERLRGAVEDVYASAGRPPLVVDGHLVDMGSDTAATAAGYAIRQILKSRPDLAPVLVEAGGISVLREALGPDMHLELAGALISDTSRPFFKWHNHVGGMDDLRWKSAADYPRVGRPQRVLMLVYLQPVSPSWGSLLVLPRPADDAREAPYSLEQLHWDGEEVVEAPAGTAVLIEQSTWHAALPQTCEGLRMFVGFYYAAAHAPPGPGPDDGLVGLDTDVELLRSVLPPRRR